MCGILYTQKNSKGEINMEPKMDFDRLKHSYAVARKMVEIGKSRNLGAKELHQLFVLGLNHDIGYAFPQEGIKHSEMGGIILKNSSYEYWEEVYYHGDPDADYESLYLDILNQADMQIDKFGNDVGYEKRLDDIKSRYGEDSSVYQKCLKLVNKCKRSRNAIWEVW